MNLWSWLEGCCLLMLIFPCYIWCRERLDLEFFWEMHANLDGWFWEHINHLIATGVFIEFMSHIIADVWYHVRRISPSMFEITILTHGYWMTIISLLLQAQSCSLTHSRHYSPPVPLHSPRLSPSQQLRSQPPSHPRTHLHPRP